MTSTARHHLINNIDLMTNLSTGAFHKIYLIDNNGNEEDIDDRYLKKTTFNTFLNRYDLDFEYLLKLHLFQNVQINGGTYDDDDTVNRIQLPNTFTSDGKADKFHTHQISEVIQLPEQLNQKRNKTDYNFRNVSEDLVINGLKFKCSNQEKDLCVVLGEINKKLDDLVDSVFGLDVISDFETISNVISNFLNPVNPYNWTSNYFENSNLKNGLVHALINFLTGRITNALDEYSGVKILGKYEVYIKLYSNTYIYRWYGFCHWVRIGPALSFLSNYTCERAGIRTFRFFATASGCL